MQRTFWALVSTIFMAAPSFAQSTLHVPSQYPTIQDAINAADPGDTVLIADGDFAGFFLDKSLTIMSENGPEHCIITSPPTAGPAFIIVAGSTQASISGLTLRTLPGQLRTVAIEVQNSSITFDNCIVEDFRPVYYFPIRFTGSDVTMVDCIVQNNTMGEWGLWPGHGAAVYSSDSNLTLVRSAIRNNSATHGQADPAGMRHEGGHFIGLALVNTTAHILDSIIKGNFGGRGGGTFTCQVGSPTASGTDGGDGWGITIAGGNVTFINTLIARNGGGSGGDGTLCPSHPNQPANGGDGGNGGGVRIAGAQVTFINSTVAQNRAGLGGSGPTGAGADGSGSGIYAEDATVHIHNTILWGNSVAGADPLAAQLNAPGAVVTHSCIQGLPKAFDHDGNFGFDPRFVDSSILAPDYRLSPNSPAIDAGNNALVPTGITTDLDGNPRFHDDPQTVNIGAGTPPIVDVGAFEFQGTSCYANCTGSTEPPLLTVDDFLCFIDRFAAGDPRANCDQSTTPPILTINDFLCFINHFALGCP